MLFEVSVDPFETKENSFQFTEKFLQRLHFSLMISLSLNLEFLIDLKMSLMRTDFDVDICLHFVSFRGTLFLSESLWLFLWIVI